MENDKRQVMIVYQSSITRAVEILTHNNKDKEIDPKEVVMLGWKIAKAVINPEHVEKMIKEGKKKNE